MKRAQVFIRYLEGRSIPKIIKLEYLPYSTIRSIINRGKKEGRASFYNKPWLGHKLKTTNRDNQALLQATNKDIKATLYTLGTPLKSTKKLGYNTVRKILKVAGKSKRCPYKKLFLIPEYKYFQRLQYREQKKLGRDQNKVCQLDEVTFYIRVDRSMFYVTCIAREEYLEKNLKPSFKSRCITIGVQLCFYRNKIGPLVILKKGETIIT